MGRTAGSAIGGQDRDSRTGGHLDGMDDCVFVVGVGRSVVLLKSSRPLESSIFEIVRLCGPKKFSELCLAYEAKTKRRSSSV